MTEIKKENKKLLIVESPTKVRTLEKFLPKEYKIIASRGHLMDLLKTGERNMGIDIENEFKAHYGPIDSKKKTISELKKAAATADEIYLATDPDREGEAIAWHISQLIEKKKEQRPIYRISFNEITKNAVLNSLSMPGEIDKKKVDAQETRRKLDRIVGFKLSGEILWSLVAFGLSAGRVQSVALKLICEREKERNAFQSLEYWEIVTLLEKSTQSIPFNAKLHKISGELVEQKKKNKFLITTQEESNKLKEIIENADLKIQKVEKKERRSQPSPPFITSTLQREISTKLRFSAKRTMSVAQKLYEGINLGKGYGNIGLITYMRTDSVRISPDAVTSARDFIQNEFGEEFLPEKPNTYKTKQSAQDAHESIRPTNLSLTPEKLKTLMKKDEFSVYELIWKRFLASQMTRAIYDQTVVDINADELTLRASGSVMKFAGFMKLYEDEKQTDEDNSTDEKDRLLPELSEGESVLLLKTEENSEPIEQKQHFTQPPARFSDASLVKKLEDEGIGRPSTYASFFDKLETRRYVSIPKGKRQFEPTVLGMEVNKLLTEGFPKLIDVNFTGKLESDLDNIESGTQDWLSILQNFYKDFNNDVQEAKMNLPNLKKISKSTGRNCPECNENELVEKFGRNGWFIACSSYPKCKHSEDLNITEDSEDTKTFIAELEEKSPPCSDCGSPMKCNKGRFGFYLSCSENPKEHTKLSVKENGDISTPPITLSISCGSEGCDGKLVERKNNRRGNLFYGCSKFPKCRYILPTPPVKIACPKCNFPHLTKIKDKEEQEILSCPSKGCDYSSAESEDTFLDSAQTAKTLDV